MRPAGALACLCLLISACGGEDDLAWELTFTSAALKNEVFQVDARIHENGCGGAVVWSTLFAPGDGQAELPPVLEDGSYCFSATARNTSCQVYAQGETTIELPGAELVVVELGELASRVELCEAAMPCNGMGNCAPPAGCAPGTADCDANMVNGCEVDLDTRENCGGCGVQCGVAESCCNGIQCCVTGTCGFTCP
ncbi:MAG: hypothetical protein AAGF12_03630 [Myxococcota bacterium]